MTAVTFKILHGADRGKVFEGLSLPLTVGREEGNDIQLNDERVSRCHFKVQRDNDRLVLTDLDSTNGTKVNGVECQLKILRHGDLIAVGRSLMLVGSETQIASRLAAMGGENPTMNRPQDHDPPSSVADEHPLSASDEMAASKDIAGGIDLPALPHDLSPGQKAQVAELLDHLQARLHRLIDENNQGVTLKLDAWQKLVDTQAKLAVLCRRIADPD
jgi:pSer/pThr/pTyr-binding forkhead associated (FHA) protein